ncbi:hypothetical protein WJX81_004949 [Elliptochloris bilobata]|uniref:Peptidase S1 domain-containing protein n=1 Tax=Elliptochloris bilobata TaxID=381761 RepID=A0AAW1QJA6_9CHLO
MRLRRALCACVALAALSAASGQPGEGKPLPWTWANVRGRAEPPEVVLPAADPAAFLDRHGASHGLHLANVAAIAREDFKEFEALDFGEWEALPGGVRWHLALRSPGAASLALLFSDIRLPAGGQLAIYAPSETANRTHCAGSCMLVGAFDVPASHRLTTLPLPGDTAVLEYMQRGQLAAGDPNAFPVLRIASVMQGVGELLGQPQQRRRLRAALSGRVNGTQFDLSTLESGGAGGPKPNPAAQCTPSAACNASWALPAAAVVDIYAINARGGVPVSMGLCTGTVVSAASGSPYLLTSDRCFTDKTQVEALQFWLLVFNRQAACAADAAAPPITQVMQGVKLLFEDHTTSIMLLTVPGSIPSSFKVYMAGVNAVPDTVPHAGACIQHPGSGAKRIATADGPSSISAEFPAVKVPSANSTMTPDNHLRVVWSTGATSRAGSLGAPLFDNKTQQVVGVLVTSTSSCAAAGRPDYFGRLSAAWDRGLRNYLGAPSIATSAFTETSGDQSSRNVADVGDFIGDSSLVSATAPTRVTSVPGRRLNATGPGLGFLPDTLVLSSSDTSGVISVYLTDPPDANETVMASAGLTSIGGNGIEAGRVITLAPATLYFGAGNYSTPQQLAISRGNASIPGNLLRFDATIKLSSAANRTRFAQDAVKGIVMTDAANHTSYKPIAVSQLPYTAKSPITAPSGRALWRYAVPAGGNATLVSVQACVRTNVLQEATLAVYEDGRLAWVLESDPEAEPGCISVDSLAWQPGSVYELAVSDADYLAAVLPVSLVKAAVIAPSL